MPRPPPVALVVLVLVAASCSPSPGSSSPPLLQILDARGPATVGPSVLAGADVAELNALIGGAGGDCPQPCWSTPSDPAAAYFALIATGSCEDRDLATSASGSRLIITVTWKSIECRGIAAQSTVGYSLFSAPRKRLPPAPVPITVRYAGQTVYPGPQTGSTVLDLQPTDPAVERGAVAEAIDAARADAGGGAPRDLRLAAVYRLPCPAGVESYVVRLARASGGPQFIGQYVGGAAARPEQGCPAP